MTTPPDADHEHSYETTDSRTLLESRGLRAVRKECTDDDCNRAVNSVEAGGDRPDTYGDLRELAYELYESFYDDPRRIGYMTLSALVTGDFTAPLPVVDYLAAAVDQGVEDARDGVPKRTRDQLDSALPDLPIPDDGSAGG